MPADHLACYECPGKRHREVVLHIYSSILENQHLAHHLSQSFYQYLPFQFQGEADEF